MMLGRKTTSIIVSGIASGWSILWLADLLAMFSRYIVAGGGAEAAGTRG